MAYATIAGLPIQVGLYTALVPMAVYAMLGGVASLSVSTTSTIAILTAGQLAAVVPDGSPSDILAAAVALALMVGAFLLAAGFLRLGFLADLISDPVLTGFKAGIGLVIVADQLPKLMGVHIAKVGFARDIVSILGELSRANVLTIALALTTLVLMVGLKRFLPRLPGPLVAVVLGIAASALFGLGGKGVEVVGGIPSGPPPFLRPDLALAWRMWPGAIAIALMAFTESVAAGRAFALKGEPRPDANRELRSLGLANLAGSFFGAMPAGGGTSQTAVNSSAGARTQAAELITAALVVATLLFMAPLVAMMPQATLAVVVVVTTAALLNPAGFRAIRRVRTDEFLWAVAAFAGVVFLGTLYGILVAVAISLLTLMYQASKPPVYAVAYDPRTNAFVREGDVEGAVTVPGLLILRTEGRLHFANAVRVGEAMRGLVEDAHPRVIALECSGLPDIEYTALSMLTQAEAKLRSQGIALWLVALNPGVHEMLRRSPLGETLGSERVFRNLFAAVESYKQLPEVSAAGMRARRTEEGV
jgi:high affinity sulfate transporter 1